MQFAVRGRNSNGGYCSHRSDYQVCHFHGQPPHPHQHQSLSELASQPVPHPLHTVDRPFTGTLFLCVSVPFCLAPHCLSHCPSVPPDLLSVSLCFCVAPRLPLPVLLSIPLCLSSPLYSTPPPSSVPPHLTLAGLLACSFPLFLCLMYIDV